MSRQTGYPESPSQAGPNIEPQCLYDWSVTGGTLISPSVTRNRDPILAVLRRLLPQSATVLEIASGTGEHAVYFAAALPHLQWQPTDYEEQALNSIAAHRAASGLSNLLAPLRLDAAAPRWPVKQVDAVVARSARADGRSRTGDLARRDPLPLWAVQGEWRAYGSRQ
jgi:hypothetical protein